jgi:hypothetical protein
MVAYARTQATPETAERVSDETERQKDQSAGIAKLALLHAEAEETARLANLLGRSLYAAIALPLLGVLTVALAGGTGLARPLVWCAFVAAAAIAMLRAYFHTIGQPFERVALKSFAKDMSAILLYAGFAWGAGAFLALPAGINMAAVILFAAAPGIAVAALLREREAVFLFLAPVATLASFASVLRPFAGGALAAGLILIACAAVAAAIVLRDRRGGDFVRPAMLPLT